MPAPTSITVHFMSPERQIVVCDGDETGQELLDEALRVLDPGVLGFALDLVRFDLSLGNRRTTANEVVREAASAMREQVWASRRPPSRRRRQATSGVPIASCEKA